MRKIYSLVLMAVALLVGTNAWGATVEVATYDELRSAVTSANNGDVIKITADMIGFYQQTNHSAVNIKKSITIDGQGHTLYGYGKRGTKTQYPLIAINHFEEKNGDFIANGDSVDVVIKNANLINPLYRVIETRGKLRSLTIDNCLIEAESYGSDYDQPITIGGSQASQARITIKDSKIVAPEYYPIITFNPIHLTLNNTEIKGWCAIYFKGISGSAGSRGSVVVADDCKFNCPNYNSGETNAFGMFVCEDDGISITLNNCAMDAEQFGDQYQTILVLSEGAAKARRTNSVSLTINGDNTYINGKLLINNWAWGMVSKTDYSAPIPDPYPLSMTITGGTYAFNPEIQYWYKNATLAEPDKSAEENKGRITIPDGYEVKEIKTYQGTDSTILYRVRKEITTSHEINQNVEGQGAGLNDNTEFIISGESTDQTLTVDSVVAHYVEVSDSATLTIPSGKSLEVTNGLDVTNGAQVVIEAGSTVKIGEGGVTAESVESIVIEADDNGSASFILDPAVIVNTTPNLTVKMKAKQIGWISYAGSEHYFWHRFALPIQEADSWVKNPNKDTYVFGWNYSTNDWEQLSALTQMVPFKGYTLTADYKDLGDVEYTFTGRLAGNIDSELQFERNGFNFFGNSYTGYIDILALVDQIMGESKIDGTVWMWYQGNQSYVAVPLQSLRDNPNSFDSWMREVAPMQTFILKQNGSENASTQLDYASAVWGNPRYGNKNTSAQTAPQRIQNDETTRMRIIVTADNGKSDFVMLSEEDRFSDAFEKGYDGEKYMNENALNMYATVNNVDYTVVATDNLAGKTLTIQTVAALNYTMSFAKVNGETYAIRDLMTNIVTPMTEGNTYTFAAQPNTTIEGRFVIVPIQNMPTDVETVENTTAVKGIYTVTGQYVGEDFDILPAGMYIVNGVKIVK